MNVISNFSIIILFSNVEKIDFSNMKTYGHMVLCIYYLDSADVRKTIYNPYKSFLIAVSCLRNDQN